MPLNKSRSTMTHSISQPELTQPQKERLRFIDFRLYFFASLNRNDLTNRFGIKEAAATRDIAAYRGLRPNNALYDANLKSYKKTNSFKPLVSYQPNDVLKTISTGIGDASVIESKPLLPCETPATLTKPNIDIIATITNAIALKKGVEIKYFSLNSGGSYREIIPFTLVSNGLRWHVRGYERKKHRFRDFVLTRILDAQISDAPTTENELWTADIQWNRVVELHLTPHPKRKNKQAIELDYQMNDSILKVNVRAALAGYLLRLWNIDCSSDHHLEDPAIQLWLKNTVTLYGVDTLAIAPGYEEKAS